MNNPDLGLGKENVVKRNCSMDVLRILACLAVIIVHAGSSGISIDIVDEGTDEWYYCMALDSLFKWSVPIFVMITGFFFLKPEKELPLKKLYKKYILRLVLCLIFWSWFYAILLDCRYTKFYPFGGQHTNFWYIGMCIGLYMSMPVLRIIAANEKVLAYSCWIWLFMNLYTFIGHFVDVPILITDHVFYGYIGFCLWGYYLSRVELNRRQTNVVYLIGVLSSIITLILPWVTKGKVVFALDSPGPALTSIAIFLFVIKHPIQLSPKFEKVVTHVSGLTLGIYMAHTFVIFETYSRIYRYIPNMFLLVPIVFGVVFVLSYLIVLIIKQIPILKKWVV